MFGWLAEARGLRLRILLGWLAFWGLFMGRPERSDLGWLISGGWLQTGVPSLMFSVVEVLAEYLLN